MLPASPPVTVILFKYVFLFTDLENKGGKQRRGSGGFGKAEKKLAKPTKGKKKL